ncbi:hypothetical protein CHISP_1558 [Chitinispirillum alkaliphilum]|nr:hypothetical protein CHISP_1558 [Chitinispirillum alkaliphilum]
MSDALTFICIYLLLGKLALVVISRVKPISVKEMNVFTLALLFRISLTYLYWMFSLTGSADARMYFNFAQFGEFNLQRMVFNPGTESVRHFTAFFYPIVRIFENQYLMTYIPFSLLGFVGSILFYMVLKPYFNQKKGKRELYILVFFLPNLVFWTSNIGKDSLVYFGLSLVIYGSQLSKFSVKQVVSIGIGCIVSYYARPHLIMFLMFGFGAGLYLEKSRFSFKNIAVFGLIMLSFFILHQRLFQLAGIRLDEPTEQTYEYEGRGGAGVGDYFEAGIDRLDRSAENLSIGGSATGPRRFNLIMAPLYIIEFICSPFIWQARTPIQLLAALESLIYQFMLLYLLWNWKLFGKPHYVKYKFCLVMYILIMGVLLGAAQTNFGLTVRQKCMVLPFLILNFSSVRQYKKEHKVKKKIKAKPVPVNVL